MVTSSLSVPSSPKARKSGKGKDPKASEALSGPASPETAAPALPTPLPAAILPPVSDAPLKPLKERALLVNLAIGVWQARRVDKQQTSETLTGAKAEGDAGNWWTRLVPPTALSQIDSAAHEARIWHYEHTLPWSDRGPRILSAELYLDYMQKMRACREKFDKAIDAFVLAYPGILARAAERLGTLYKPEQFPTAEAVRNKFSWTLQRLPLPEQTDFRVQIGEEEIAAVQAELETSTKATLAAAGKELFARLFEGVSNVADKLGNEDSIIHSSLLANLGKLCELLPKMNLGANEELEAMRKEVVAKLVKQDTVTLRSNPTARSDAAAEARKILDRMKGVMA